MRLIFCKNNIYRFSETFGFNAGFYDGKDVERAFCRHLEKLAKRAFRDRQLLIGNLLRLAKDAYEINHELFAPICERIKEECRKENYELKLK